MGGHQFATPDADGVCRGGPVQRPMLEGAAYVGDYVTLFGAGRHRRGGDRVGPWPRQHDARRLARSLAKTHAAARTVPIRRHHRNYGDDLGDGSLGREAAGSGKCNAGSLHRCRAHILHFLFRLWGLLFLRGGRIVDSGGFSRRMLTGGPASLRRRRNRQRQQCGRNGNRQNTHERHPHFLR